MVRITQIRLIDRLLLIGPPGIGKTEHIRYLAEQEAKRLGKTFVDVRRDLKRRPELVREIQQNPGKFYLYWRIVVPHVFPEDLSFPLKVEDILKYVQFIAPRELMLFTIPDIYGVMYLDEITNVARKDQESMTFSWINEKEIAWSLQLSDNVKIVAAGNPPEVSSVASTLSAPLINRMIRVYVEPPTVEEWIDYMVTRYGDGWDRRTAAFLMMFRDSLYKPPKDVSTLDSFPTPRSWTRLALLLRNELQDAPREFVEAVILGCVGDEVGAKFAAFIVKKVPRPEEVIEKPEILGNLDVEAQYLAMSAIAENIEMVLRRGERLFDYLDRTNRDLIILLFYLTPRQYRRQLLLSFRQYFENAVRDAAAFI